MSDSLIVEAMLNGLWQTLLLAGFAWLVLKILPSATAGVRYVVWYAVMLSSLIFPLAYVIGHWPAADVASMPPAFDVPADTANLQTFTPLRVPSGWPTTASMAVWLFGAALLLTRLVHGFYKLQRLKAASKEPEGTLRQWSEIWRSEEPGIRPTSVVVSHRIRLPMTAGLRAPSILFPASLVPRLTEQDARSIWLHETSHVRRMDDWTKLAQRLIESILFFHPGVRWLGKKLDLERELACDEWVVRRTGEPRSYATCLARLAEFVAQDPDILPAVSMARDRKQIFRRVEMLLNPKRQINTFRSGIAGAIAVVLLLFAAVGLSLTAPVLVMAQESPATPSPAAPAAPAAPPVPAVTAQPPAPPQAPAPPASGQTPPAPPVSPAAPAQPEPNPKPAPELESMRAKQERVRAMQEAIRAERRELRQLSREMEREMREQIRPQREEIRKLTEELRLQMKEQIRPMREKSRELARQMREQSQNGRPDPDAVKKLEQQINEMHEQALKGTEAQLRAFEEKIRAQEITIKPPEEQLRKMKELIQKHQEMLREAERQ